MESLVVIAIANRKGGTGKTTTAINLASLWANQGIKTLLVDMDTQGHAGIGVGIQPKRGEGCLHRLFTEPSYELSKAVRRTSIPNLWLIPACPDFDGKGLIGDYRVLNVALSGKEFQEHFERVVLDTPPTLDHTLVSALAASNGVLVPFQPHHLSLVAVRQLAALFYRVASTANRKLSLLGLLPVMADPRLRLHRQIITTLGKQFGIQRIMGIIRPNIRLAEAFAEGLPINLFAPKSSGAADYQRMCSQFEKLLDGMEKNQPHGEGC